MPYPALRCRPQTTSSPSRCTASATGRWVTQASSLAAMATPSPSQRAGACHNQGFDGTHAPRNPRFFGLWLCLSPFGIAANVFANAAPVGETVCSNPIRTPAVITSAQHFERDHKHASLETFSLGRSCLCLDCTDSNQCVGPIAGFAERALRTGRKPEG